MKFPAPTASARQFDTFVITCLHNPSSRKLSEALSCISSTMSLPSRPCFCLSSLLLLCACLIIPCRKIKNKIKNACACADIGIHADLCLILPCCVCERFFSCLSALKESGFEELPLLGAFLDDRVLYGCGRGRTRAAQCDMAKAVDSFSRDAQMCGGVRT
ncbi:hypothetical protein TRVL_07611 [Trypanosoma vivax]|nr:hypothetical protein TRVL_07611 [Trypanosoma vivax]